MRFKPLAALAFSGLLLAAPPVQASDVGTIIREALTSGDLEGGSDQLAPYLASEHPEAMFGTGLIWFVSAVEELSQALYRHGFETPATGPLGPEFQMPVPRNPDPEPVDYDKVREILSTFVDRLDAAREILEGAGAAGDYVVVLDPMTFRIDVNGDGTAETTETIGNIIGLSAGLARPGARPDEPPSTSGREAGEDDAGAALPDTSIGFDRADAIWLAGYSQVLAGQADFVLAHDFSGLVETTFHRFFPRAGLPMQDYQRGGQLVLDPETDTAIADLIAFIHTLNWPVVEPDRLARVLVRGKSVLDLSRRNWDAILAETDDQRELVPSPSQTSIVPDGVVTDEVVAAWRETLDVAERVLDGDLLAPHWRFAQGFDLNAYFETATRTDIVMLLTGYDAVPFLRDGPVASAESFAAANRVLGNDLLGYVFWFN